MRNGLKFSSSPIIVLFGPRQAGKTACLIRLTHWLLNEGYQVELKRDFRQGVEYQEQCDRWFNQVVKGNFVAGLEFTGLLLFIVSKNGDEVCQLLDDWGGMWFDEGSSYTSNFPLYPYQTVITSIPLPKVWLFFMELDAWACSETMQRYGQRVSEQIALLGQCDCVMFLVPKVDQFYDCFDRGKPSIKLLRKRMREQYSSVFVKVKRNRFNFFDNRRTYEFIVFSSGSFVETHHRLKNYTSSSDFYPQMLWKKIMGRIRN